MRHRLLALSILTIFALSTLSACADRSQTASDKISVVATTNLVGDVVQNIGGDQITLKTLVPAGVDVHGFEPTAQDMVAVTSADVIFYNGAGLEPFIDRLLGTADEKSRVTAVSDGISLQQGHAEDEAHASEDEDEHEAGDPHVWTDPNNVMIWADNIEKTMSEADPENAAVYKERADIYRQKLADLDQWIARQVEQVPTEKRKLVTDHLVFTYFANRYGFEQVGAMVSGYSTLASPSAQEIAELENNIRAQGVPVIFTGSTFNPALAERVTQDTNTRLVQILTGSLTGPDGPAPSYLDYMRFNVSTIVNALK